MAINVSFVIALFRYLDTFSPGVVFEFLSAHKNVSNQGARCFCQAHKREWRELQLSLSFDTFKIYAIKFILPLRNKTYCESR